MSYWFCFYGETLATRVFVALAVDAAILDKLSSTYISSHLIWLSPLDEFLTQGAGMFVSFFLILFNQLRDIKKIKELLSKDISKWHLCFWPMLLNLSHSIVWFTWKCDFLGLASCPARWKARGSLGKSSPVIPPAFWQEQPLHK